VYRSGLFLVTALLLCTSCRDEAAEAFVRAELKHKALIDEHARPDDARFDVVIADLQKVTPSSRHYDAAQKILKSVQAGRGLQVRTPLALGGNGRRPLQLEAQLAACARLAAMAGADGGVDQRALLALEKCRHEAELLELRLTHPEEYDEDGGHRDHP
jgi:hypothetical protein